jgi:hypothetical protein
MRAAFLVRTGGIPAGIGQRRIGGIRVGHLSEEADALQLGQCRSSFNSWGPDLAMACRR